MLISPNTLVVTTEQDFLTVPMSYNLPENLTCVGFNEYMKIPMIIKSQNIFIISPKVLEEDAVVNISRKLLVPYGLQNVILVKPTMDAIIKWGKSEIKSITPIIVF